MRFQFPKHSDHTQNFSDFVMYLQASVNKFKYMPLKLTPQRLKATVIVLRITVIRSHGCTNSQPNQKLQTLKDN